MSSLECDVKLISDYSWEQECHLGLQTFFWIMRDTLHSGNAAALYTGWFSRSVPNSTKHGNIGSRYPNVWRTRGLTNRALSKMYFDSNKHYLTQMLLAINWRYWQAKKIHAGVWRLKVASCKSASLKSAKFSQEKRSDTFITNLVSNMCLIDSSGNCRRLTTERGKC